ncbi:UNVERIFIED_CONTAM: hypothetical protein FKN15_002121 [Acipenser sinensis]
MADYGNGLAEESLLDSDPGHHELEDSGAGDENPGLEEGEAAIEDPVGAKRTNRPGISTTDRGFPRARFRSRGTFSASRSRYYSGFTPPRGRGRAFRSEEQAFTKRDAQRHARTHTHAGTHARTHRDAEKHTHIHTVRNKTRRTDMHARTHAHTHTYRDAEKHTHARTHAHTDAEKHTHTHTQ